MNQAKPAWKSIPNWLSAFRLAAAIVLPIVFNTLNAEAAAPVALALFVAASITDGLDGWIARRFNQISRFGAHLDPLADKALLFSAIGCLGVWVIGSAWWYWLPAIAILIREIFVVGLRIWLEASNMEGSVALPASFLAKVKTTVQLSALTLFFAAFLFEDQALVFWGGGVLFAIAAVLTVWSGWTYATIGFRALALRQKR